MLYDLCPYLCYPRLHHKDDKRQLNRAVDRVKKSFDNISALNIDAILPSDKNCFQHNGDLNPCGNKIFWNDLNLAIKRREEILMQSNQGKVPLKFGKNTFFKKKRF